jgi:hypothetical protein
MQRLCKQGVDVKNEYILFSHYSSFVMELCTSWLENDFAESRHIEHSTAISCLLDIRNVDEEHIQKVFVESNYNVSSIDHVNFENLVIFIRAFQEYLEFTFDILMIYALKSH